MKIDTLANEVANDPSQIINAIAKGIEKEPSKVLDALLEYGQNLLTEFLHFIPTIIFAFVALFLGFKLVNLLIKALRVILNRRMVDKSVASFTLTASKVALKIIVIVFFISILGFEVTVLITMLGAAGLAIGLALQGTLQNLAGGVVILVLKPFRVGDTIEFGGQKGTVIDIRMFDTKIDKLTTNETVIVPNSIIASSTLINWRIERERRIELPFGIAYGESIEKTRKVILEMAAKDDRLLVTPSTVVVTSLGDSSVNLELRVWVRPSDFFDVQVDMLERIYNTLNENSIPIPFPQLDVQIKK